MNYHAAARAALLGGVSIIALAQAMLPMRGHPLQGHPWFSR
jgi:hypothetical protein